MIAMRPIAAILPFILLLSLANAAYVAHFAPSSGQLNSTSDSEFLAGAAGNYGVLAYVDGNALSVALEGEEESQGALAHELFRLQKGGIIITSCDPAGLLAVREGAEYYCNEGKEWFSCTDENGCQPLLSESKTPAPAAVTEQALDIQETAVAQENAPLAKAAAQGGVQPPQSPYGAPQAAASEPPAGIAAEQLIPLVAAFLAVIIISFLLLQQRQVQAEIGPQELGLLQNETRAGIMSELEGADRIPTDLSSKLGKSKATVVEHLETLRVAGFVERLETPGKKFVYYRLTRKGKQALLKMAG